MIKNIQLQNSQQNLNLKSTKVTVFSKPENKMREMHNGMHSK